MAVAADGGSAWRVWAGSTARAGPAGEGGSELRRCRGAAVGVCPARCGHAHTRSPVGGTGGAGSHDSHRPCLGAGVRSGQLLQRRPRRRGPCGPGQGGGGSRGGGWLAAGVRAAHHGPAGVGFRAGRPGPERRRGSRGAAGCSRRRLGARACGGAGACRPLSAGDGRRASPRLGHRGPAGRRDRPRPHQAARGRAARQGGPPVGGSGRCSPSRGYWHWVPVSSRPPRRWLATSIPTGAGRSP